MNKKILSPAKINLRIKIRGINSNFYHLLDMVNVKINFYDKIDIEILESKNKTINVKGDFSKEELALLNSIENNLASKAAVKFLEEFEIKKGFNIKIDKLIPSGAGLGGGSSNAGTVLKCLYDNLIKTDDKSFIALQKIAKKIGADVSFFLFGNSSIVQGIGDLVTEIPREQIKITDMVFILPSINCDTEKVFDLVRQLRDFSQDTADKFISQLKDNGKSVFTPKDIENDLEEYALEVYPELEKYIKAAKVKKNWAWSLSGSGSTIFGCPLDGGKITQDDFEEIVENLKNLNCKVLRGEILGVSKSFM